MKKIYLIAFIFTLPIFGYGGPVEFAIGAEISNRDIRWGTNTGDRHFASHNYHQATPFVAFKFYDWIKLKFGLQYSETKYFLTHYGENSTVLELFTTGGTSYNFLTRTKFRGWYGDFLIFLPFNRFNIYLPVTPFISIGITGLKARITQEAVSFTDPILVENLDTTTKYNLRLGLGADYYITKNVGINFHFIYENNSNLETTRTSTDIPGAGPTDGFRVAANHSYLGTVGIFFSC